MRSSRPARPCEVERVLHVAGRVVRRHVQRLEAVEVVVHLGPVVDLVAHGDEDVLQLLAHRGQRMARAARGRRPGSVTSTRSCGQPRRALECARSSASQLFEARLDRVLQRVELRRRRLCAPLARASRASSGARSARRTCVRGTGRAGACSSVGRLPRRDLGGSRGCRRKNSSRQRARRGRPSSARFAIRPWRTWRAPAGRCGRRLRRLRGFHERGEPPRIVRGDLGERLAVEADARPLEARHELAVGDVVQRARRR